MSRTRLPCARDVTATLDAAEGADGCVVACPPHPQMGGSRSDRRLRAVSDALVERGVACLRFDYGPWDEGRGERRDADCALEWAAARYDRVGLFGYSFGGAVALVAATDRTDLAALAVLAPAATLGGDPVEAAGAVGRARAPTLVVHGERDETVDWETVADRVAAAGGRVVALPSDHHFAGMDDRVADAVAPFLAEHCGE